MYPAPALSHVEAFVRNVTRPEEYGYFPVHCSYQGKQEYRIFFDPESALFCDTEAHKIDPVWPLQVIMNPFDPSIQDFKYPKDATHLVSIIEDTITGGMVALPEFRERIQRTGGLCTLQTLLQIRERYEAMRLVAEENVKTGETNYFLELYKEAGKGHCEVPFTVGDREHAKLLMWQIALLELPEEHITFPREDEIEDGVKRLFF